MSTASEPFLTIPEAAAELKVSQDTIRREISRGNLKAVRIGRVIRIRRRDLDRALKPVTRIGGDAA